MQRRTQSRGSTPPAKDKTSESNNQYINARPKSHHPLHTKMPSSRASSFGSKHLSLLPNVRQSMMLVVVALFLVCLFWSDTGKHTRDALLSLRKDTTLEQAFNRTKAELVVAKQHKERVTTQWNKEKEHTSSLQKEIEYLTSELTNIKSQTLGDSKLAETLQHINDMLEQQTNHLQTEIQRTARKAVLDQFGEGPYKVELKLDFPPETSVEGTEDTVVLEMASLDLMPHSVHLFMEQVSHKLLDGCSFHRNAGHVVQGGPVPYYKNPSAKVRELFHDADLVHVSFQEYHKEYPHEQYTVGYAGRPGGPDFYISVANNTQNHGPGGQTSYKNKEEADPCFAKVVEGFEAVERMHKMPVKDGAYNHMENNVGIQYAKILSMNSTEEHVHSERQVVL